MALALLRRRRRERASGAGATGVALPLPPGAGALGREVVDPMGQPMGAADVTVTALDTHRVVARGTTDPYGYFFAALPPGQYSLMIAAEGLHPHRETVDVAAGPPLPPSRSTCSPPAAWSCRRRAPGSSTRPTRRSGSSPSMSAWPMCTAASSGSTGASRSPRTWRTPGCTSASTRRASPPATAHATTTCGPATSWTSNASRTSTSTAHGSPTEAAASGTCTAPSRCTG